MIWRLISKWPNASLLCHSLVFLIHSLIPGQYGYSKNAWRKPEKIKRSGQSFKDSSMLLDLRIKRNNSRCDIHWGRSQVIKEITGRSLADCVQREFRHSRNSSKTRRSRDVTWAKNSKKSYFGYKLHQKKTISITVKLEKLRLQRQVCMKVRLICQSKTKLYSEIGFISVCTLKVMILPWCAELPMSLLESLIKSVTGWSAN